MFLFAPLLSPLDFLDKFLAVRYLNEREAKSFQTRSLTKVEKECVESAGSRSETDGLGIGLAVA